VQGDHHSGETSRKEYSFLFPFARLDCFHWDFGKAHLHCCAARVAGRSLTQGHFYKSTCDSPFAPENYSAALRGGQKRT
jgi:hypothetical protein